MSSSPSTTWGRVLGLGAVAGSRAMTAPALLSYATVYGYVEELEAAPFAALGSRKVLGVLGLLAGGELVVDKLGILGSRLAPRGLTLRVVSGALVGATLARTEDRSTTVGAVLGALAAVAAAHAAYHLRTAGGEKLGVPDRALAVVEDAVAVSLGLAVLRAPTR